MLSLRNNDVSSIIERKKADFLQAVKSKDLTAIKNLLQDTSNQTLPLSTIYECTDKNKKSALDYAIEKKNTELFILLLSVLYSEGNQKFGIHLKNIPKKKAGSTPLHLAAQLGHEQFFELLSKKTADATKKTMWSIVNDCWLNAVDQNGNTPLHLAMRYHPGADDKFIGAKRHIVAKLVQIDDLDLSVTNANGRTVLVEAAKFGFFETAKVLLRIYKVNNLQDEINLLEENELEKKDKEEILLDMEFEESAGQKEKNKSKKEKKKDKLVKLRPSSNLEATKKSLLKMPDSEGRLAEEIASKEGHQQIYSNIYYYKNPKQQKIKTNTTSLNKEILENWAKDPNFSEEKFMTNLKVATFLTYQEAMSLIDLRVDSLSNSYRRKAITSVVLSSVCPAITGAAFLGTLGGLNPEPVTASIITAAAFPAFYIPFVYKCYKIRTEEFSNTAREAMRFNLLATRLPKYEQDFANRLNALEKEAVKLNTRLDLVDIHTSSMELQSLNSQSEALQKGYSDLKTEMNDLMIFTNDGKSKLALSYISRPILKSKKRLGVIDPKENPDWTSSTESMDAFVAYNTDILCPLGAGLNIAAVAASLVMAKYGAAVYGLTAVAGLAGPVAALIVGVVGTLALGCLIGALIYKSSFQAERRQMGAQNRNFIDSYNNCRMKTNMDELRVKNNRVVSQLEQVKNRVAQLVRAENSISAIPGQNNLNQENSQYEVMEVEQKSPATFSFKSWFKQFLFCAPKPKTEEIEPIITPEMALHRSGSGPKLI